MATFKVTNSADSGEGSLREAIALANVSPGLDDIFLEVDVELVSAIAITDSVNIGTPFGATITQIGNDQPRYNQLQRIFEISDGNSESQIDVSLFRLNLTGGQSDNVGGAILSYENLTIVDSQIFENSVAVHGAAVYVEGANLTVERSQIFDNQIILTDDSAREGGLYIKYGELTVTDSVPEPIFERQPTEPAVPEFTPEESSLVNTEQLPGADLESEDSEAMAPTDSSKIKDVNDVVFTELAEVTQDSEQSIVLSEATSKPGEFLVGSTGDDSIVGSNGNDTILGNDGLDTLEAAAGNDNVLGGINEDALQGNSGNDTLQGGAGDDRIEGGDGDDILNGADGNDILDGGSGADNLNGGDDSDLLLDPSGNNLLFGNEGNDILIGGLDADNLNGSNGDDELYGAGGDDTLSGGSGNDRLKGSAGNDTLMGGDGYDLLDGGTGDDIIHGDSGNDYLVGFDGDDTLHGGLGNDTLSGDLGYNFLTGGEGQNVFNLTGEGFDTIADFDLQSDRIQLSQISYDELIITGGFNSYLSYQGLDIAMVMGVSPVALGQDKFMTSY